MINKSGSYYIFNQFALTGSLLVERRSLTTLAIGILGGKSERFHILRMYGNLSRLQRVVY